MGRSRWNLGRALLASVWLAAFGLAAATPTAGEPEFQGAPLVRSWSAADYGGHAQNWAVHQAANGLVYVANNRGLLEFDGVSWRLLPLPDGAVARTILSDAQGRVWVGGAGTICVLEPDANGALQARSVTSDLRVEGGALNNGLARLQVASAVRTVAAGRGLDQSVTALIGDAAGRLWVGGPQGVQVRPPGEARFVPREDLPGDVFGFTALADDELLVAGRGLQSVRDGRALPTAIDRTSAGHRSAGTAARRPRRRGAFGPGRRLPHARRRRLVRAHSAPRSERRGANARTGARRHRRSPCGARSTRRAEDVQASPPPRGRLA